MSVLKSSMDEIGVLKRTLPSQFDDHGEIANV